MDRITFENRAVIVTGSGRGIGAAYAKLFASRQAKVVVNDIDRPSVDETVAAIRAARGIAIPHYESIGTREGAKSIVDAAVREFGRIDVVINNAGWNPHNSAFEHLTEEELTGLLSVHFRGALYVAQNAWPHMKKQRYGRIVNASSSAGIYGIWGLSAYGAAKMGQVGLTHVLALEGAEHGILVNAILPGAKSTWRPLNARPADLARNAQRPKLLQDRGTAEFVAPMVVYLASEACTRTHCLYNASGGYYSNAFIGVTKGWLSTSTVPPTPEEVAAHLDQIEDRTEYHVPTSNLEESDHMSAMVREIEASGGVASKS